MTDLYSATIADVIAGLIQIATIGLMAFVFYTILQIVRVVREEFAEKQEHRFQRWYDAHINAPRYTPPAPNQASKD